MEIDINSITNNTKKHTSIGKRESRYELGIMKIMYYVSNIQVVDGGITD